MIGQGDTSCHGFSNVYHKAITSINNKKIKQDDALNYLSINKEELRSNLRNKNQYVSGHDNQINIGIKLLKLSVDDNENPFIKMYTGNGIEKQEVGKIYNDEYEPITFLRDNVFKVG